MAANQPTLKDLAKLSKHLPQGRFTSLGHGKQRKDIPEEVIRDDNYKSQDNAYSFKATKARLILWMLAITERYYADPELECELIFHDEKGHSVNLNADIIACVQIKVLRQVDLLYTFYVNLKKGLIMIESTEHISWGTEHFPSLLDRVNTLRLEEKSPTKPSLNSTTIGNESIDKDGSLNLSPIPEEREKSQDSEDEELTDKETTVTDSKLLEVYAEMNGTIVQMAETMDKMENEHNSKSAREKELSQTLKGFTDVLYNMTTEFQSLKDSHAQLKKSVESLKRKPHGSQDTLYKDVAQMKQDISDIKTLLGFSNTTADNSNIAKDLKEVKEKLVTIMQPQPFTTTTTTPTNSTPTSSATSIPTSVPTATPTATPTTLPTATRTPPVLSTSAHQKHKQFQQPLKDTTTTLLVGPATLSDIDLSAIDPSGNTVLRTFDPMEDITAISTKLGAYPVHKGIKYVIIQTGDIDSQSLTPMTQNSVSLLIGTIKLKFPQSQTTISACLFPKGSRQSSKIDKFNQMLQETCAFNSTRYINLSDRFQDEAMLNEDLTFSDAGIRQLAKSYSYALKPDVRAKTTGQPQGAAVPPVNNPQAPSHSQEAKPQNQRANGPPSDKKDSQLNYVATNVAWGPLHNGFQAFGARAKSRLEATVFNSVASLMMIEQ